MPPVECLSTTGPGMSDQDKRAPDSSMARVQLCSSPDFMPRMKIAISRAAA
ncbi:MAG: hypothetical protein R3F17_07670 [Planctomycetota bacterium]